MSDRQQVAVVTGGGGGIGAAIALELGRDGWFVVTVDPMVTLDGSAQLPSDDETTAGRIVAAGGSARASAASVTDGDAVRALFDELVAERGGVDAVVNVAGITRQSGFAHGTEEDWMALLDVHLNGYLNMLRAALPHMAAAGHGHILGITSGSGWRAADAGGYSSAKRAVASLTWQLGRVVPAGVTVNAMSPIAATRMVAAAIERARAMGRAGGGGGLSLHGMAGPEDLGPLGAHLVGNSFGWCNGRVVFACGSEMAVVDEPRLVEVVRTGGVASVDRVLDAVVPKAFAAAEARQMTEGGSNPRFGPVFGESFEVVPSDVVRSCAVVSDRPEVAASIVAALSARSVACHRADVVGGFADAAKALGVLDESVGPIDAVVVACAGSAGAAAGGWEQVLDEHAGIVEQLHADASWARAVADYAAAGSRPVRLVTVTDAVTAGGRSRAQAAAQLARVGGSTTEGRVAAFSVSVEAPSASASASADATGALVGHLLGHPDSAALAGAELAVGAGWVGLRSHPRPIASVTYGGPAVPEWLDSTLQEIL